ncbi:hypothetical protein SAMN04488543_2546 [Friedmanniella luteola]|uniref:Uncharacterized protein n=1 Tax=Friedmanniella luteola TaxID=546871 RepID=A0A1H1VPX8_9ACTN|nr:hypothetical protein [Friedmanniella luteola]SDS86998.1 hypothetical protein SAMN04488543_2546 [Friedmanniella luteola]
MSLPAAAPTGGPGTDAVTVAPVAPGRLGVPLTVEEAARYLPALERWSAARRTELDALDKAALASPQGSGATPDLLLSLALWKAVADRAALLTATWAGGRVGAVERERLSTLVWGRLDTRVTAPGTPSGLLETAAGLAVSLPEACRLSDALVASLRVRLGLDLSAAEVTARLRALRAQLERIREQVGTEPAGRHQQEGAATAARLARRLADVRDKAGRGGDVDGLLGPLEIEASTAERDLIVGAARRREAASRLERARGLRTELEAREAALAQLVQQCVATVDPAPRYAVPDVSVLGPVPNTPAALDAYLDRLEQVSRAMSVVQGAYGQALRDHEELVARLDALRAKATALGVAEQPDLRRGHALAAETLERRPCPMGIAQQLVALYLSYLGAATAPPRPRTATLDRTPRPEERHP